MRRHELLEVARVHGEVALVDGDADSMEDADGRGGRVGHCDIRQEQRWRSLREGKEKDGHGEVGAALQLVCPAAGAARLACDTAAARYAPVGARQAASASACPCSSP